MSVCFPSIMSMLFILQIAVALKHFVRFHFETVPKIIKNFHPCMSAVTAVTNIFVVLQTVVSTVSCEGRIYCEQIKKKTIQVIKLLYKKI